MRGRTLQIAIAVAVGLVGCAEPSDRPADWSYIHTAIVVPSCATARCHSSLTARAGIDLEDEDRAYQLLVDEQLVVPGDPSSSLIYLLDGDERTRMPPDAPLPAADVELIEQWIVEGAAR